MELRKSRSEPGGAGGGPLTTHCGLAAPACVGNMSTGPLVNAIASSKPIEKTRTDLSNCTVPDPLGGVGSLLLLPSNHCDALS
jgi:hypothetical protein